MHEGRKARRGRTYFGGKITFKNQCYPADCIVRNVSPHGAKLTFPSSVCIPDEFDLAIDANAMTRRARLVWMDAVQAGVVFDNAVGSNVVSLDAVRHAAGAEADRQVLARRITQVTRRFDPK